MRFLRVKQLGQSSNNVEGRKEDSTVGQCHCPSLNLRASQSNPKRFLT